MNTSRFTPLLFPLRNFLRKWRLSLAGFALGFYIGIFTNLITSTVELTTFQEIIARLSPINRPLPIFLLVALIPLLLPSLALIPLDRYCTNRRWEILLANLTRARSDPSIAPYSSASITWGGCLTLQSCPDLQNGWTLDQMLIRQYLGPPRFSLNRTDRTLYTQFREENRDKKWYGEDGTSLRLAKNPVSFSDEPSLTLDVQECRYSEVQYTNKRIATLPDRRKEAIDSILQGQPNFAHSFVAHIVILTADIKVLATLSSNKKDFFCNTWSFSIEEQLSTGDLRHPPEKRVAQWLTRALEEELGVTKDDFIPENIRALSVFIEGYNLNCGLCVVAQLSLSQKELTAVIEAKPRTDYEFTDFKYLGVKEVAQILRSSRGWALHPTSEYRMFLTLVYKLGTADVARRIFAH